MRTMNNSKTPNINLYLFWFTILVSRLSFIFIDASSSRVHLLAQNETSSPNIQYPKPNKPTINPETKITKINSVQDDISSHLSASDDEPTLDENIIVPTTPVEQEYSKSSLPIQSFTKTESNSWANSNPSSESFSYQPKNLTTKNIQALIDSYSKTNDKTILPWLVKKLVKNYQFDEAYNYFSMMDSTDQKSDPNLHLYLLLNQSSINISSPDSIQSITPILNQYKSEWLISDQENKFYQALIQIRYGKYDWASTLLTANTDPDLQSFIQGFKKAKSDFFAAKDVPSYYLDWLVSLSLMKNGYFSIAKKIALETLDQNDKYSLPYQVLAYTNFLTNNTEAAADYFLKLAEFDQANKDSYKFFVWVSYFRANKYSESVLYLSQVTDEKVLTDTYRYLTLAYEKLGDNENISRYQQKLLGQFDIDKSDFYTYFYQTSFFPYSQWKQFNLYNTNQQLYVLFMQKCELSNFQGTEKDVCNYGKIWFDLIQNTLDSQDEDTILTLANNYSQWYLYQILWDMKNNNSDSDKAKSYYSKALKSTSDSTEKEIIKTKIANLTNLEKPLFSKK